MSLTLAVVLALSTTWTTGGPTGGRIAAVAVAPSNPDVVWAGDPAGVFRSTDGGATWTNVSGPVVDVDALVVDPTNPDKAWVAAGTWISARVWRTSDGGATWIDSTDGLPAVRPSALYLDPRNPDTLYLGSKCGPIGFATIGAPQPEFHETAGVFKSTDGGAHWQPAFARLSGFTQCVEEMAVDPFSPWRVFISGPFSDVAGQHESYDAAQSWEHNDTPRPAGAVVFDARFPFTHYGITSKLGSHFFVSQDGGFTWDTVKTNIALDVNNVPTALSMDPQRSRIFLGTTKALFRSGNGGSVWAGTTLHDVHVTALDFGRTLFAGTVEGFVEVTNRGLGVPRAIDLHDAAANVMEIAVDPSDPNVVYADVRTPYGPHALRGRVYRSTNAGASWERLANDDDLFKAEHMSIDAAGTLYAFPLGGEQALYRRGRNDAEWRVLRRETIFALAAHPLVAGTLFIGTIHGVERSRDSGATWQAIPNGAVPLAFDPKNPLRIYGASARSDDGGDTWTVLHPNDLGTDALVVAPSNGNVLYRIAHDLGYRRLERSDDAMVTWRRVANDFYPMAVAVDPRDENSVWIANDIDLWHSADGGAAWQKVDPPFLVSDGAIALRFDPAGRLHVVYPEHGVWELQP